MKTSNLFSIIILVFLIISILANLGFLTTKPYEPNYNYFINPGIISIYITATIIDLFLFILIAITFNNNISKPQLILYKKFTFAAIIALICLIWLEIILGLTEYNGFDVRQNGLIVNNWGIIGSILFFIYFFNMTDIIKLAKYSLLIFILILHIFLFLVLTPVNILNLTFSNYVSTPELTGITF